MNSKDGPQRRKADAGGTIMQLFKTGGEVTVFELIELMSKSETESVLGRRLIE